jgi:hypothetical protein
MRSQRLLSSVYDAIIAPPKEEGNESFGLFPTSQRSVIMSYNERRNPVNNYDVLGLPRADPYDADQAMVDFLEGRCEWDAWAEDRDAEDLYDDEWGDD